MNLNILHLIGRVTQTPEFKTLQGGTLVTTFGLATNNIYVKNGEKVEETDFHNIVVFGKMAETIKQYVVKGQELYVSGRIKHRSWDKKDGSGKGYATEVICSNFQFGQKPAGAAAKPTGVKPKEDIPIVEEEKGTPDTDIPF